jgi:hypothetical protein
MYVYAFWFNDIHLDSCMAGDWSANEAANLSGVFSPTCKRIVRVHVTLRTEQKGSCVCACVCT